jgi:hypothetical protein
VGDVGCMSTVAMVHSGVCSTCLGNGGSLHNALKCDNSTLKATYCGEGDQRIVVAYEPTMGSDTKSETHKEHGGGSEAYEECSCRRSSVLSSVARLSRRGRHVDSIEIHVLQSSWVNVV